METPSSSSPQQSHIQRPFQPSTCRMSSHHYHYISASQLDLRLCITTAPTQQCLRVSCVHIPFSVIHFWQYQNRLNAFQLCGYNTWKVRLNITGVLHCPYQGVDMLCVSYLKTDCISSRQQLLLECLFSIAGNRKRIHQPDYCDFRARRIFLGHTSNCSFQQMISKYLAGRVGDHP